MREVGDALVYMYDDSPLFPERRGTAFYSALAQARYLKVSRDSASTPAAPTSSRAPGG